MRTLASLCSLTLLLLLAACGGGSGGGAAGPSSISFAVGIGGGSGDTAEAVGVLSDGTTVVVGSFRDTAVFGQGETNQTSLTSAGVSDVYVARYDAAMHLMWVRHIYGPANDQGLAIAVTSSDAILVAGSYRQALTFSLGEPNPVTLQSNGSSDTNGFLARFYADGSLDWVQDITGSGIQAVQGLSVASDGTAFVTGLLTVGAVFAPSQSGETTLPSFGAEDAFVASYDVNGQLLWAKLAGGTGNEWGEAVGAHPAGGCVVTGSFSGSAIFGFFEVNNTVLTSAGGDDAFIARFDSTGDLLWAKRAGGPMAQSGRCIATTPNGAIYVTGDFESTMVFAPGETSSTVLNAIGTADVFLARYLSDGSIDWATQVAGSSGAFGKAVATRPDESIVIGGHFKANATFDPGMGTQTILTTGAEQIDAFVACYTTTGAVQWALRAGGMGTDRTRGLACLPSGHTMVVGNFQETAAFGIGDATETTLQSFGASDAFVARFGPTGVLQ